MRYAAILVACSALAGCFVAAPPLGHHSGYRDDTIAPQPRLNPISHYDDGVPSSWRCVASEKWKSIVIHHSATENGGAKRFDREHYARIDRTNGLGYHFVIGNGSDTADGLVEVGRRWKSQMRGAHCGVDYYNQHGVGICLVGNFEAYPPTKKQMASLEKLIKYLKQKFSIKTTSIIGHRHVKNTLCPGRYFPYRKLLADLDEQKRPAYATWGYGK